MRSSVLAAILAVVLGASSAPAVMAQSAAPYKVLVTKTVGGDGRYDYLYADASTRRLYVPRLGPSGAISIFDLDSLAPVGTIAKTSAHGVAVDEKTIDLGGAPEQTVSDGNGRLYVVLEDKNSIAVVDARALKVTAHYDLAGKGGTCTGLAIDRKNGILFAACRDPHTMVVLNAGDGRILATLPIGSGTDGATFNPKTMEAFSAQSDGTLSIIKEESPTTFSLEQTLQTRSGARTLTLDSTTNRILLVTADFTPPPPAAPGATPGRPQMVPGSFSIIEVGK